MTATYQLPDPMMATFSFFCVLVEDDMNRRAKLDEHRALGAMAQLRRRPTGSNKRVERGQMEERIVGDHNKTRWTARGGVGVGSYG